MKKIFSILFGLVLVAGLGLVMSQGPAKATTEVASPTTWYVAEGGAGAQDGRDEDSAFPTIQEAIDAAGSGDSIMVAAGEYAAFLVEARASISIIGAEGATVATTNLYKELPVVGSAWVLAAVYDSEDVNIEGINFDGTGVSGKTVAVGIAYVDSTGRIADLTVENVIATELGAGVAIIGYAGTAAVQMTGATISDNDNAGIYVCGGSTLEAHLNKIADNAECGLLNDGGETVDAIGNWWGHKSGPLHQTNILGRGNAVVGDVDFKPWLEAEAVTNTVDNDILTVADTEVEVKGTATVSIAKYASNPHPSSSVYQPAAALDVVALSDEFEELGMFRDVRVVRFEHATWVEIRLYYTDGQARKFDEDSLRPFWWNRNDDAWVPCSPDAASGVNTTDVTIDDIEYSGYMWARITATTTPSLADLGGTPWGGYGHPSGTPQPLCFIASASYGTHTSKEIDILREFRDIVLLPNSLGAGLVSLYHKTSPPIAGFISQHEVPRTAVRVGFVDPIARILGWSHDLWSGGG